MTDTPAPAPPTRWRKKPVVIDAAQTDVAVEIPTLEGTLTASPGDWIITGVKGERYPCKPDIFAATYEPVDAPPPPERMSDEEFERLGNKTISGALTEENKHEIHVIYAEARRARESEAKWMERLSLAYATLADIHAHLLAVKYEGVEESGRSVSPGEINALLGRIQTFVEHSAISSPLRAERADAEVPPPPERGEIREPGEIAGYLLALKNGMGHVLDMDDLMQRIMRHDAVLRAEVAAKDAELEQAIGDCYEEKARAERAEADNAALTRALCLTNLKDKPDAQLMEAQKAILREAGLRHSAERAEADARECHAMHRAESAKAERLRAALEKIADGDHGEHCHSPSDCDPEWCPRAIAREALAREALEKK